MSDAYRQFIASKAKRTEAVGLNLAPECAALFPFQRDIVAWALRQGRAAIFAECGMGKTLMQLEWAARIAENKGNVLILAPLAVSHQTIEEGRRFGIESRYSRDGEVAGPITVTNYEMLHRFCADDFAGVVLDESSILKAYDGKTRNAIISTFGRTPYRLACTATPAPNDFMELGNHSEFLGQMSRTEMLSMFFVHDGGETQVWRLKGHAQRAFWEWVSSWGVAIQKPSDLGYADDGFVLPPLVQHNHVIEADADVTQAAGFLFAPDAMTLNEQRAVKRASIRTRVEKCAELAAAENRPWVIWCELNDESSALADAIPGAVEITGSMSMDEKERRLDAFSDGSARVLVTKPSIAGFGLNWQHCDRMAFVSISHSFEMTYQAIRRCWRYGQKNTVHVHTIRHQAEGAIEQNLRRKQDEADRMQRELSQFGLTGIVGRKRNDSTGERIAITLPEWLAA